MSEHTIAAPTSEAMQELGRRVAGMVHGGDVLLLSGPLGAGKTTFAQGFGAGLDITEPIVSPTFTIARELDGHFADGTPAHLVHVDAYRLGGSAYAPGQDVLDLCCCTGGFSVHAALYGAKSVEAVARPRRQPQLRPGPVSEGQYPADRMNP